MASALLHTPFGFDLTLLTGPVLIASFLNWGLFGLLTVQTCIYYVASLPDHRMTKVFVAFLYAMECIQLGLSSYSCFQSLASGSVVGDFVKMNQVGLDWLAVPVFTALINCCCQLFYAWRIYAFSRNFLSPVLIACTAVGQLILGVWIGAITLRAGTATAMLDTVLLRSACTAWFAVAVLADSTITCSMVYHLWKAEKVIITRRIASIVSGLIRLTVETSLICTATNIVTFILYYTSRHSLLFLIFIMMTSKLYSNCLLVVLNSRVRVMGQQDDKCGADCRCIEDIGTAITFKPQASQSQDENLTLLVKPGRANPSEYLRELYTSRSSPMLLQVHCP